MTYDLQIVGTIPNGSCYILSEGRVVLSYRIGTNGQWKAIQLYMAESKLHYEINIIIVVMNKTGITHQNIT